MKTALIVTVFAGWGALACTALLSILLALVLP
jgi:hypothetical protein